MAYNVQSKDLNGQDAANSMEYTNNPPAGPPPYTAYPTGQLQYGSQPVHVTTVVPGAVLIHQMVGSQPTHIKCRSCNVEMVTRIETKPTLRTHIMAGLLCLLGCWPCVCIPYCMDSCLSTDHYCSNCGAFLGTYIR